MISAWYCWPNTVRVGSSASETAGFKLLRETLWNTFEHFQGVLSRPVRSSPHSGWKDSERVSIFTWRSARRLDLKTLWSPRPLET